MKFSVLIANYNNGKYFKDCYNSIIAQTYTNWEAIIVDDASTDNSIALIKELVDGDHRFKLYKNDVNRGCGYTKRKTLKFATGEVCGFLDPDDALLTHSIEKLISAFYSFPDVVLVHSTLIYCTEKLEQSHAYTSAKRVNSADNFFFNLDASVTHFVAFVKRAYDITLGIDPYMQRAVDQDLYLKMAETGPFHFLNEPLYLYRIHPNSISKNGNWKKALFWHWFAAMQAAKRRNINLENVFINSFSSVKEMNKLKKIIDGKDDGRLYVKMLVRKLKHKLRKR